MEQDQSPRAANAQNTEKVPKKQLFRQSAYARVTSPEQLGDYIRVANPGVWLVLAAIVILLAALLIWSAMGTLPTTIDETCVAAQGVLTCYRADVSDIAPGMRVRIGNASGTVTAVSDRPDSSREVGNRYSDDYTLHMLGIEDWNYEITIDAPEVRDGLVEATIVTGEVHPISFIFN